MKRPPISPLLIIITKKPLLGKGFNLLLCPGLDSNQHILSNAAT